MSIRYKVSYIIYYSDDNYKFYSQLENTNWFEFIYRVIKFSKEIVKEFLNGNSVLVHCTDGWDRSSQLLAISQILMDPYFRTGEGFCVLIEKEFAYYGHQFALRTGIKSKTEDESDQKSPIFIQFLDIVYQLMCQFPNKFEFNEELLLFLIDSLYSLKYGTFIFNCEQHREENYASTKTISVWSDIFEYDNDSNNLCLKPTYINKSYDVKTLECNSSSILNPTYSVTKFKIWKSVYHTKREMINLITCGKFLYLKDQKEEKSEDIKEDFKKFKNIYVSTCDHFSLKSYSYLVKDNQYDSYEENEKTVKYDDNNLLNDKESDANLKSEMDGNENNANQEI